RSIRPEFISAHEVDSCTARPMTERRGRKYLRDCRQLSALKRRPSESLLFSAGQSRPRVQVLPEANAIQSEAQRDEANTDHVPYSGSLARVYRRTRGRGAGYIAKGT